jgi:uncharacterized protein YjdB
MKNFSARKLRRLVRKNRAAVLVAVAVLAVGLGLFASKVLGATMTIDVTGLGSVGGAYRLSGTLNDTQTLHSKYNGTVDSNQAQNIYWNSNNAQVVSVVQDTTNGYNATLTSKSAGHALITVGASANSTGDTVTPDSIHVFVPLVTTCTASNNSTVTASDRLDVSSSNIFPAGTKFTITGTNVTSANQLNYKIYRCDGTEVTSNTGLADDVIVSNQSTDSFSFTVNSGGVYKVEAYTQDYEKDSDAAKIDELKDTYYILVGTEFTVGNPSTTLSVDYVTIDSKKGSDGTTKKYAVLNDVTKPYALLTNLSTHGSPSSYGVTWKSSDTDVATVQEATGSSVYNMVQGVHAGVSKITMGITGTDVAGNSFMSSASTDECYIVVPFIWSMTGITTTNNWADSEVKMNVGDSYQLSTSGKSVAWAVTSDNNGSYDITADGVFMPHEKGVYTVSAILNTQNMSTDPDWASLLGGDRIYIKINVIDSFGLSEDTHTLKVDDEFDLQALVTDSTVDVTFTWSEELAPGATSTGESLVQLTPYAPVDGGAKTAVKVKGLAQGYARITATQTVDGVTKTASCLVTVVESVHSLSIDPDTLELTCGEGALLTVVFNNSDSWPENQTVLWTSSDESILKVEANGNGNTATVTADANNGGDVTVMVVSQDGLKSNVCNIHVRKPVTGVTLNKTEVTGALKDGQIQLVATVSPSGSGVNQNVKWSSTNTSVVTVDENGLVSYVGTGYASIICETEDKGEDGDGFKTFCNFYINVPVESLKLDCGQEVIMSINENKRITAEVLPITASQRTIEWSSTNTSVCTVDSNGLVTALGHGNATIIARTIDGSELFATTNIYVKQPVEQVVMNTNAITVRKGAEFWLNATCLPESADNKICTWTSSNEEVCKVEQDGKVTAVGSGTCNIVVTNDDTGIADYCVVTVTQPVTGLTLNSDYQLMWVGAKYAIIPNVLPTDADNKKCTFESSDETVATVDEDGIVTALKGGNCVIIVTTDELHLKASVTIDVKEYVSSVKLSENDKYMNVGSTGKLTVSVGSDTATNKAVVWSSSNNSVVGVVDGNLYAYSVGNAVVTATAADGSGVSDTCVVKVVKPVESISIEPSEVKILVGDYYKLKANVTPADATVQDLRWESSNDAIATVDSDGEVVGVAVGKVKITAYSTDGNEVKGSCSVYVSPVVKITSLKINSSEITMLVGKTRQLQAFVTPTNHTESVNWYSTDTSIVAVDQNGNITTVGPGIADVVVQGGTSNIQTTCRVHALALSKNTINLGQYDWFDLAVDGSSGFTVSWRTSNPRVATVDSTGHVVARMRGTTTITATVDNKTLTCVVNVGDLY